MLAVASSISGGDIHFRFGFSLASRSSQLCRVHANKINEHSHAMYVVLHTRYDQSYKAFACLSPQNSFKDFKFF